MGICASCLGLGRRNSYDPENTHLLYRDDPYQTNYGGTLHNAPNGGALQQDAQLAKREREALDQITQRASDAVIDIFALHPALRATSASDKSSKSTHSYPSLIRNVYSVEDLQRSRATGDVRSVKEGSISREFGTVRRSRQGNLVSNVNLE